MRKLPELIVLIRSGGETGSAIAHKLVHSHFRVCITESASPLALRRGICFSEAIYNTAKEVDDLTAERSLPTLEGIYKVWRNGNIPVVVDPEVTVKPLLKPDVLINAMMLGRSTNTQITDAPLVIGIGPGFTIGTDVHLIIDSNDSYNLGRVIIEGTVERENKGLQGDGQDIRDNIVIAEDNGVFTTEHNIGDTVLEGDIIGRLNEVPLKAPISGILCGLLRNEVKVLAQTQLAEIDGVNGKPVCTAINDKLRAISGGVLEAIMMSLNIAESEV